MSDRLQINIQERCASADINDLQSMATRIIADLYTFDQANKLEGPRAAALPVPRSFTGGLGFIPDGGNNAFLTPGFLAQLSLTHPAPPGPLDSDLRLGFNRANLALVLPVPAGPEFFLLEAQVVDVITVSSVRDVFDVPTQTFIPTLITKQVERQVTTQFVGGDVTDIPAPSGDPWVPIGRFIATGGAPSPLLSTTQEDLRSKVNNGTDRNSPGAFPSDGAIRSGYLATARQGGEARNAQLVGHVEGSAFGQEYFLRLRPIGGASIGPVFESGFANPPDTIVHFYLVPIISGGVPFIPGATVVGLPDLNRSGVLVASLVQPDILGRINSAPITLPAPYANFSAGVVPAQLALYVGSAYTDGTGAAFHPFMQSEDGTHMNGDPLLANPYPRATRAGGIGPGAVVLPFDLRTVIPDNVKAVLLNIRTGVEATGITATWTLRTVATANPMAFDDVPDHGAQTTSEQIWVPIGGNKDNLDFFDLEFNLQPSGIGSLTFEAIVLGWRT